MFTRFDTTHERESDRWTDGQTDSIDRAVHSVARLTAVKNGTKACFTVRNRVCSLAESL